MRHQGFILALAYSCDGRTLFSGSVEGTLRAWDVVSGEPRASVDAHAGPVRDIAVLPHANAIATAGKDGSIALWDAVDLAPMRRFEGSSSGGMFSVAANAERVMGGCFDGSIRIWRIDGGELAESELHGHTEPVTSLACLTDMRLASAGRDCVIRVWDIPMQRCRHVLRGHTDWVTKIRALPDGNRIASVGEDGQMMLWDSDTARVSWHVELRRAPPIWGLAVDPTGTFSVAGAAGNTTRWSLAHARFEGTLPTRRARTKRALAIAPDGTTLAAGGDDSHIELLDLAGRLPARFLEGDAQGVQSAVARPDGRQIVTGHVDGTLRLHSRVELSKGAEAVAPRVIGRAHGGIIYALQLLDESRYASGAFDGRVHLWELGQERPYSSLAHDGLVFSLATAERGRLLLVGGGDRWSLWNVANASKRASADSIGSGVHSVAAIASDAAWIASAGEDDLLRIWTPDGALERTLALPRPGVSALRAVPGRRAVLAADQSGRVSYIDLDREPPTELYVTHEDWVRSLHVTPDARFALSVSQECDVVLYDIDARRDVTPDALRRCYPAAHLLPSGDVIAIDAAARASSHAPAPSIDG